MNHLSRFRRPAVVLCAVLFAAALSVHCGGSKSPPAGFETLKGDLHVKPIQHGTLVLKWKDTVVYVDPVGPAELYKGLPAPNLVLITHPHPDHLSADRLKALRKSAKAGMRIVLPKTILKRAQKDTGLPAGDLRGVANGDKLTENGIGIEAAAMYNLDPKRMNHKKGDWNGYVLDFAGTRVYISGDTEDIPEMRALKNIHTAFVCMNLPYTMTAERAASAVLAFRPVIVYPYHYRGAGPNGTQDPAMFAKLVRAGNKKIEVRVRDWYGKKP